MTMMKKSLDVADLLEVDGEERIARQEAMRRWGVDGKRDESEERLR